jgi:aromatic-L-amino-acid decarboxylase
MTTNRLSDARLDLDPDDWDVFRELVHGALDRVIAYCGRSVAGWFGKPRPNRLVISSRLPFRTPHVNLRSVLEDFERKYQAIRDRKCEPIVHGLGAWCRHVSRNAGRNTCGGAERQLGDGNHIGIDVENQIALWAAEQFGFPSQASGVFLTGTSTANLFQHAQASFPIT